MRPKREARSENFSEHDIRKQKFRYHVSYFGGNPETGSILTGMVLIELDKAMILRDQQSMNDLQVLMKEAKPELKKIQFGVMGVIRLDVEL